MPFTKGHSYGVRIKKGEHLSPDTEFEKGIVPWNKGIRVREKRNCIVCKKEFSNKPSQFRLRNVKCCSSGCAAKSRNKRIKRNCLRCGNTFKVQLKVIKKGHGKYCSRNCKNDIDSRNNCLGCNVKLSSYGSLRCSSCEAKKRWKLKIWDFRGTKSSSWKGGLTSEYEKLRKSLEAKLWRKAIFEKDNYTCVLCNDNKGGNLEADHIKPWALYPELRFEIDNGRTLCHNCHQQTNTYGGRVWYQA